MDAGSKRWSRQISALTPLISDLLIEPAGSVPSKGSAAYAISHDKAATINAVAARRLIAVVRRMPLNRWALASIRLLERFTLERIVQVRIPAASDLEDAGECIKRKEQRAPSLVLADVDMFVKSATGERSVVHANDDVTKGDGTEATTSREHRDATRNAPASNFKCTADHPPLGTDSERKQRKHQADERSRQGPGVPSNRKDATKNGAH